MMNVCIDAREFVTDRKTGIARYLENLLVPLVSQSEISITLFVNDPSTVPHALQGLNLLPIPKAPTIIADQFILPRMASRNKADIFFSPYYKLPLSGSFKRIMTVHDIMFLRLKRSKAKLLRSLQLTLATKKADVILVDSEYTKKDLTDYLPDIARKIQVLYPSLESAWLTTPDAQSIDRTKNKYGIHMPFFLYVGNFKSHKNVDLLIRAFKASGVRDRQLILAGGDSTNYDSIAALIRELNVGGNITICRDIPDPDLKALYCSAEWFITASEYEGFGYPILEAMSCGCPVICHPCTSIPEVTGGNAINITHLSIQSISEAIRSAISTDNNDRCTMIDNARQQAQKFVGNDSSLNLLKILGCVFHDQYPVR